MKLNEYEETAKKTEAECEDLKKLSNFSRKNIECVWELIS